MNRDEEEILEIIRAALWFDRGNYEESTSTELAAEIVDDLWDSGYVIVTIDSTLGDPDANT